MNRGGDDADGPHASSSAPSGGRHGTAADRGTRSSGGAYSSSLDVGIERVQAAVVAEIDTLPPTLAGPCRRMATAGGKHLRARLVLHAAACAGSRSATRAADAAVAIELLHLATLVHDDLMDGAPSRRGVPTINAAEGPAMALLAGDALLGAAGRLAACVSADAAGLVQQSLIDLTFGQALEEASRFASGVDLTTTLRVAEGKTGTLMSAACMLGAQTAGDAPPELVEALGAFGLAFGTSLQLIDDVLDLVSSAALYGKPTGVDFAAGTVTLPAVRALHRSEELRELLRPGLTDAQIRRALFLLRSSGGVADGVLWAQEHARRAAAALANAGPASLTAALRRMPHRFLDGQLALTVPSHRHLLQEVAHPSGMDMTTNVDSNVVRPPTGNGRAKVK